MRVREVEKLGEQLEECQREAATKEDQLYARLSIANSEKERAERLLQQTQESYGELMRLIIADYLF